MSLFGGSDSKSKQFTTVNTTTETNFRDVGLTGAAAVDLAKVTGDAGIRIAEIAADVMKTEIQQRGYNYNQLLGGSSEVLNSRPDEAGQAVNWTMIAAVCGGLALLWGVMK